MDHRILFSVDGIIDNDVVQTTHATVQATGQLAFGLIGVVEEKAIREIVGADQVLEVLEINYNRERVGDYRTSIFVADRPERIRSVAAQRVRSLAPINVGCD